MDRGEILARFERAENTVGAVHLAMRYFYEGVYTLEEALMVAVVALAEQREEMIRQAMLAPPPLIIIKTPDS